MTGFFLDPCYRRAPHQGRSRFPRFDHPFPVGIGAGPIYFLDRRNNPDGNQGNTRDLAGPVTPTAAYRISERCFARYHWNRVFTANNPDADLFLAGIGYAFRE
jgi:hypothetical protein